MARAKRRAGKRPARSMRVQERLDENEAQAERELAQLERIARVASILGPVLTAVLGPRPPSPIPHASVPAPPGPDAMFSMRVCNGKHYLCGERMVSREWQVCPYCTLALHTPPAEADA